MHAQDGETSGKGGYVAYCLDARDAEALEAQRRAVMGVILRGDGRQRLLAVHVESGRGLRGRLPELNAALAHTREAGGTLLIAQARPLARKAAFLAPLLDSGVEFLACDMPEVTRSEWRLRRDFAEEARLAASARTRAGLAAARARGVALGTAGAARARENQAQAEAEAEALRPVLEALAGEGIISVRAVAAALNERGIATARGGRWHPTGVARLRRRLGPLAAGGLQAGERPPKPPAEPPEEKIIRVPVDKIRPPEQGPPAPERSPEIRIPEDRIKTPEDEIKIPPGPPPPDIAPPPAPEERAKDGDE